MKTETNMQEVIESVRVWIGDGKEIIDDFIRTCSADIIKCENKNKLNNLGGKFIDDCYQGNKVVEIIDGFIGEYFFKTLLRFLFGISYFTKVKNLAEKYNKDKENK